MMANRRRAFGVIVVLALAMLLPVRGVQASLASGQADVVWGQGDLSHGSCTAPSGTSLCAPYQEAVDLLGNLWVADYLHNRVLMFPYDPATGRPGLTATKVLGQYGSLTTSGCNQAPPSGSYPAAPSRYTLCRPDGVAVDPQGTVYVADYGNNRVLVYLHAAGKPSDEPADYVLGQSTFSSTGANDTPAGGTGTATCPSPAPASACTLNGPSEVSVAPNGDLLVADYGNNRVLLWPTFAGGNTPSPISSPSPCLTGCFLPAAAVWGQYGSFATNGANEPLPAGYTGSCPTPAPASACTLDAPNTAIADSQGNLFIADTLNNRVLEYDNALSSSIQAATMVYGQGGSFASNTADLGGLSASSLHYPTGLVLDPAGSLWIADSSNNRVLGYPAPNSASPVSSTTATKVLGQGGSFSSGSCNAGGLSASSLCYPNGLVFDSIGNGFVTDTSNNRVLEYAMPTPATTTLTVTTTTDPASCPSPNPGSDSPLSLRCAIEQANADGSGDTIAFNIPSSDPNCTVVTTYNPTQTSRSVCMISPLLALPALTANATVINGYTQPGARPNSGTPFSNGQLLTVQIDGAAEATVSGGVADRLDISGSRDVIQGLSITSFDTSTSSASDIGVHITGTGIGDVVEGDLIGQVPAGEASNGSAEYNYNGVVVQNAGGDTIGYDGSVPCGLGNSVSIACATNIIDSTDDDVKLAGGTGTTVNASLIGGNGSGPGSTGVDVEGSSHDLIGGTAWGGGRSLHRLQRGCPRLGSVEYDCRGK